MGLAGTVLRNSMAGIGAQLAIKSSSFGFSVLVVRRLGAEQFGQYAAVLAFGAVFVFLADLGLGVYTVREVSRLRFLEDALARVGALFGNILVVRLVLGAGTAVLLVLERDRNRSSLGDGRGDRHLAQLALVDLQRAGRL